MATQQELIEQNLRLLVGDLQLQLIFAKAQIVTLEGLYNDFKAKAEAHDEEFHGAAGTTKTNGALPADVPPTS